MTKVGEKFFIDARGIKASGIVTDSGFKVLKGSQVRNHIASYLAKRDVTTLTEIENSVRDYESKVTKHLREMGFEA